MRLCQFGAHGPIYAPDEPAPGIVILHGSEGPMAGWSHRFAAILAAHGFAALPLSYGTGDFWGAGPIQDVPIQPMIDAAHEFAAHDWCSGQVGLFGWSMGGQLAMLLASLLPTTKPYAGIAAHAPSDVVMGAFDPAVFRAGRSWRRLEPDAPRAWVMQGEDTRLAPGREIAVERYEGPMFLSVGLADDVWSPDMTARLAARRENAGRPVELWQAEGQGHGFDFDTEPELWRRLTHFFSTHLR